MKINKVEIVKMWNRKNYTNIEMIEDIKAIKELFENNKSDYLWLVKYSHMAGTGECY